MAVCAKWYQKLVATLLLLSLCLSDGWCVFLPIPGRQYSQSSHCIWYRILAIPLLYLLDICMLFLVICGQLQDKRSWPVPLLQPASISIPGIEINIQLCSPFSSSILASSLLFFNSLLNLYRFFFLYHINNDHNFSPMIIKSSQHQANFST